MKLSAPFREEMQRAQDPHPTLIQRIRATVEVELRDGTKYEFIEEAWA